MITFPKNEKNILLKISKTSFNFRKKEYQYKCNYLINNNSFVKTTDIEKEFNNGKKTLIINKYE